MASEFKPTALFGGAMVADIPSTFEDVSEIRQVPDNQEVWLDAQGFSSMVFDILERVDKPNDLEALKLHLSDIAEDDKSDVRVLATGEVQFAKLPPGTPAYALLATSPPGEKQRGRPNEADFVGILLTLVRLVEKKTDILVAINVPHINGSYDKDALDIVGGKYGPLLGAGMKVRERLLESFEVRDWSLFVQE